MKITRTIRIPLTYATCLMLAFATPMSVYAEEPTTEQQVEPTTAEPVSPEPADPTPPEPAAPEAPVAPDPATPVPPEPPETFTFDSATQKWNSNKWQWDAASGKYVPTPVPVENKETKPNGSSSSSKSTTNTAIANALDSIASTGNAGVKNNTTGGSALSGDAAASATIINNVNSTMSNTNNKEAANFVMDIYGDVNGDIMLEPMLLKAMLEAKAAPGTGGTVNATNNTSIVNDVNLTANSGDAEVSGNTKAGNATTGSANAMANVMNLMNSMIAANQSFDGTVNIYGNLNGDILIAPDFLAQMLASNGIPASANGATKLNAKDTQEIVNNVTLAAESGAALIGNNTSAGDATSGAADTNLVIFNMTGHEIVAANSLLVFINVLGSWVGVIVDAPAGATSAALADGVSKNDVQPSMIVDATNDAKIVNNINLAARSGNASVVGNTMAGNATTGNATASANIANISNSSMGLTGWFGRLFINVFGTWNGSFGVNTSAGNSPTSEPVNQDAPQVIRFVPTSEPVRNAAVQRIRVVTPNQAESQVKQASADTSAVLAANDARSDIPTQQDYINARKELNIPLIAVSFMLIIGSGFILRRFLF